MNVFRLFVLLMSVTVLAACATPYGRQAPMGHPEYGGFHPGAKGPQPGDYALKAGESLKRVQDFASCDGEGFADTRAHASTSERDFRFEGYSVRVEQRAQCTKMGGQVIPPRGLSRREPGQ